MTMTRRDAIGRLGGGLGSVALAAFLAEEQARANPTTHHAPKATAVIQLFMHGGPSHVDLLDPKPALDKFDGKAPPSEVADDEKLTGNLLRSPFKFTRAGKSGTPFSEVLPNVATHADDIAVIRSMFTEHRNHEQALWMMPAGLTVSGRPSLGSWAAYGLGSENKNLPAYVVLPDPKGLPVDGIRNWASGWMPPTYQGPQFRSEGTPVLNLSPKAARGTAVEKGRSNLLADLNAGHKSTRPGELELDARIASFELAARMQLSATSALDLSSEPLKVQEKYGLNNPTTRAYGLRCLMARRLVERGVRFVQVFMAGQPWDTHNNNNAGTRSCCQQTDQPVAALLADLKQIGLLDKTLVIWGGEFGRTPGAQGKDGRDHHPYGFSVWLAGGGVKGGVVHGATDDFGYRAVTDRCKVSDLHATILHLLGLDHKRLTYHHHGRDERLTDVFDANPVKAILS